MKTIAMFVGELEFGDFPFVDNLFWNRFTLLLFVFFVLLVMMNLLTGVALMDGQDIMNESRDRTWSEMMWNISFLEESFLRISWLRKRYSSFDKHHVFHLYPNLKGKTSSSLLNKQNVINEVSIMESAMEIIQQTICNEERNAFELN